MNRLSLLFCLILLSESIQLFGQTDKVTTARIVTEKHFVFVATAAIPMSNTDINKVLSRMPGGNSGGFIQLNGTQYNLIITKDSITCYLPYYGRSYSAPASPTEGGIKFNSKNFSYQSIKKQNGGWTINIDTKDVLDNYRMRLDITANGYATLQANNNNKQSITYNGYINIPKNKK